MIYMPDDFIFRKGDIGEELYIVANGTVFVLPSQNEEENVPPIILTEGAFFGEIALFMQVERTRSVQAQTMTEVNILNQEGFSKVTNAYPAFAVQIRDLVNERLRNNENVENSKYQERFIRRLTRRMDDRIRSSSIGDFHKNIDEEIKQERKKTVYESVSSSTMEQRVNNIAKQLQELQNELKHRNI